MERACESAHADISMFKFQNVVSHANEAKIRPNFEKSLNEAKQNIATKQFLERVKFPTLIDRTCNEIMLLNKNNFPKL